MRGFCLAKWINLLQKIRPRGQFFNPRKKKHGALAFGADCWVSFDGSIRSNGFVRSNGPIRSNGAPFSPAVVPTIFDEGRLSSGARKFGSALYDFTAGGDDELNLVAGEELEIEDEVDGWYFVSINAR
ncbi:hypothetical protein CASFOL_033391 [Castilleja foliolosa]|uniref:SH3 domain-containing protein n=1 Tax=Castilleja foliolosa TaxID=1961234 RepID=A0ABD3BZ43_9LAMI